MIKTQCRNTDFRSSQSHMFNISNIEIKKVSEAQSGEYMRCCGSWGIFKGIYNSWKYDFIPETSTQGFRMEGLGQYVVSITDRELDENKPYVDVDEWEVITADKLRSGEIVLVNGKFKKVSKILKTRVEFDDGECYHFIGTAKKPRVLVKKASEEELRRRFEAEVEELLKARPEYRQIWKENWKK